MAKESYVQRIVKAAGEVAFEEMTPRQRVELILDNFQSDTTRFHTPLSKGDVTLLEASSDGPGHARTLWRFENTDYWGNGMSNLHGGAHATVFDLLTSFTIPIISKPDFWLFAGVSRTLSVTYLRPAPSDEPVLVDCELVHIGKRMAVLKATMRRTTDGAIISTCEHHKVNTDPPSQSKL